VIDVQNILANPELIRNARINLRPRRMLLAAIVVFLAAGIAISSLLSALGRGAGPSGATKNYLPTILVIQAIVLLYGGGIACLQSITREKELNTFDYQRITRLSPLDLAIGKLLGAPSMAYFIFACFIPAALIGLTGSTFTIGNLLDSYALMLLGALSFHAFTLLISMLLSKSLSTGAILVFLFVASFAGLPWVFVAILRVNQTMADPAGIPFYSFKVPLTPFFSFVYASLTAWFMLALMRNIKRDPSAYELYTPLEALAFTAYLDFLFIGCMGSARLAMGVSLISSIWTGRMIFFALGLVLLRNRERSRRRLRELGDAGLSWLEAFWPIPYLLAGNLVCGFFPLLFAGTGAGPASAVGKFSSLPAPPTTDFGLLIFQIIFMGISLSRDVMFLQWMNVRPGRRPLIRGILYLIIYYVISSTLFLSAGFTLAPAEAAIQAVFAPMRAFLLTQESWHQAMGAWLLALLAQCVITYFLAFLHRQELLSLATRPKRNLPPAIPTSAAAPAG
jgi:hypothetical protein